MALVCLCHGVSDRRVRREIDRGATTLDDVVARTAAGSCCHSCHPTIETLIDEQLSAVALPRRRRRFAAA